MTPRMLVGVVALALLASEGSGQPIPAGPIRAEDAARVRPEPPDVDLLAIRDIFRYGDEPGVESHRVGGRTASEPAPGEIAPSPPSRVRIVGLVHRGGTPVAALAIDGEVVLLREGETGAGFTVLDIRDEAVRLRDPEGDETTLALP